VSVLEHALVVFSLISFGYFVVLNAIYLGFTGIA
jgi:hypothetical protein